MQIAVKDYMPEQHDRYRALCVEQPEADLLTNKVGRGPDGWITERSIVLMPKPTGYRGDVMICSSRKPLIPGRYCGTTCGVAELYDCVPLSELTEEELDKVAGHNGGWAWKFRNARRVVEMPIVGGRGLFTLVMPKDDVTFYPNYLRFGVDELWKRNKESKKSSKKK